MDQSPILACAAALLRTLFVTPRSAPATDQHARYRLPLLRRCCDYRRCVLPSCHGLLRWIGVGAIECHVQPITSFGPKHLFVRQAMGCCAPRTVTPKAEA